MPDGTKSLEAAIEPDGALLAKVVDLMAQGAITPHVSQVVQLKDYEQLQIRVDAGHVRGKVVIEIWFALRCRQRLRFLPGHNIVLSTKYHVEELQGGTNGVSMKSVARSAAERASISVKLRSPLTKPCATNPDFAV